MECQNFETGEELWRSKELGKGAIHYADGMLYCLGESDGTVTLVKANTKGWEETGLGEDVGRGSRPLCKSLGRCGIGSSLKVPQREK